MKKFLCLLAFVLALSVQAESFITLANKGDFGVISDVNESEVSVFLSYSGRFINHCGISLRGPSFGLTADQISSALEVGNETTTDVAKVKKGLLVAKVHHNPAASRYGEIFMIKTRSGNSISSELKKLVSEIDKPQVIVEILPCK